MTIYKRKFLNQNAFRINGSNYHTRVNYGVGGLYVPIGNCATHKFTSIGSKTIKTQIRYGGAGTAYAYGVNWSLTFIPDFQMPALTGSVASNNDANAWADHSLYVTNTGTPTITSQDSWVPSLTDSDVGDTTVNFIPGIFASDVMCNVSINSAGTDRRYCSIEGAASTSAVRVLCYDAGVRSDKNFTLRCKGKRGSL